MLDGVMLLWFIQVAIAVVFVAWDIRHTPEATVMKWGFVIITAFSGLFGALLYVLSCREPLPGTHEQYVEVKWRQAVGSTMHCVAGDGVGIVIAAVITSGAGLPMWADVLCEYALGFLVGWTVFQALFMQSMYGAYGRSLARTFLPELLSMNAVMAGMTAVMVPWMTRDMAAMSPRHPEFWFVMSIALCAGFAVALPVNWWLVGHGLKHGMMTVRRDGHDAPAEHHGHTEHGDHAEHGRPADHREHAVPGMRMRPDVGRGSLAAMTVLSFVLFGLGFLVAGLAGDLSMHR